MDLIEQLAELVGFHQSYIDSYGNRVEANKDARRTLLIAMGYCLDSEEQLNEQITQLNERPWRSMLPASHIAKMEDEHHSIIISLPTSKHKTITRTVISECNKKHVDEINIVDLVLIEEGMLGQQQYNKYRLPLSSMEQGYHQLTVSYGSELANCHLIFAPKTCYAPQEASSEKLWGYAAQLYSLKSEQNWGMGDFGDLENLVKLSANQQASVIGLNPLHPLYQDNPAHRSPYSPTSRCFLNTLYIDISQVPNLAQCPTAQDKLKESDFIAKVDYARSCEKIDYSAVSDVKFEIIEILYQDFISTKQTQQLTNEFELFKQQGGEDLQRLATYEALYEHFRKADFNAFGWSKWPAEYQQPDSTEVKAFVKQHSERINYFVYVQWLAHRQLSKVADTAKTLDMPIGLYLDLAVGCDGSGVDVWSDQSVYVAGAAVGAPPDAMNTLGQDWGLTPINPVALQQQGYLPLVKALRSNMQYAGALRIDHILGLMRQYWVAPGMKANEGIYITFPFEDILRIIALESRRNDCVVIGEDLGTVPDGFSEIMASAGLLSYKVLFFEKWESGLFKRPELYPTQSMVTVSTHDLPTLAGWWTGRDLQWRQQLDLYPDEAMGQSERTNRVDERRLLIAALNDLNVIDLEKAPEQAPAMVSLELTLAVQKYLAQANSHIQLIPLEDALEIVEQVNIPGTIDEHPNWLQKLPVNIEQLASVPSVIELAKAMQNVRPRNI